MEAGEATNESSRLVGGGGGRWKPTYETNDASASFGAVVVSKTDKKIKKNTPRAHTTRVWRRLGPVSSLLACVGLCWPSLVVVGADGSRPMKQTTRLRRLGPWLSVKRIKKIKKKHT